MTNKENKLANKTFFSIMANFAAIMIEILILCTMVEIINEHEKIAMILEIVSFIILFVAWPLFNLALSIASLKISMIDKSKLTVVVIDLLLSIGGLCFNVVAYLLGSLY